MTSLDRITLDSNECADTRQVVSTIYWCLLTFFFFLFSQVFGEFVYVSRVWKVKATEMCWVCVFSPQQASCCIPETCTVGELASSDCSLGRKVAWLPRRRLTVQGHFNLTWFILHSSINSFISIFCFSLIGFELQLLQLRLFLSYRIT